MNQEKNMLKGMGFLSYERKYVDKVGKKLMDTGTKTGIVAAKLLLKE